MTSNNTLKDVYLNRVSAFLPNAPVGNDEMEAVLGMAGDVPSRVRRMILRSNGILSRHYAIDPESRHTTHTNAELAAEAVNGLFAQGVPAEAIGSLACATSYPDQTMPGHGVMVHGLLDIPPCEVFSMAGVCAAGMAAMKHAYNAVRTGEHAHAVSVASENASAVMRGEVFQSETDHKKLIFSERAAGRSFFVWGKLLMAAGCISPLLRRALLCFYIIFLLAMILVVLPVSVILKKLLHPLLKGRLKKLADYYGQPSGR